MTAIAALVASATVATAQQSEIRIVGVQPTEGQSMLYGKVEQDFEAAHPEIDVIFEYYAGEAYKSKLPTLLQSNTRPDIFFSWGGETLVDQVEAGFTRPIGDEIEAAVLESFPQAALEAYTVNGDLVGLPLFARAVVLWTNTALTGAAGVDHTQIETWDDFLAAVRQLKEADITPIIAGGQDKWPLNFYWSYLVLREGGPTVIPDAMAGAGEGFESAPFAAAGRDMRELVALDPFQPGFMATTADNASGLFGDGKGAFHFMGDWDYSVARDRSSSGEGVPDEDLAMLSFPVIADPVAEGGGSAVLGGINGWVASNDASPEAVAFLAFMIGEEYQRFAAEEDIFIPVVEGARSAIANPFKREVAQMISESDTFQVFLDQYLGASVGATVNDVSADLAQGAITPEEGAAQIQEAWDFR
ncbi:hypothetical protein OCH239_17450 [Roseivivax halodurans JCM 10272]|uniref:ABC transporter substrate-binding protein n=2 Tax=Roseivivax halodurans TaxID=93683 RepID=X7E9U6_9RHOB|nr:hypothetical protein OCH239_17450 [Roseivivax halodurans JCM 10272]